MKYPSFLAHFLVEQKSCPLGFPTQKFQPSSPSPCWSAPPLGKDYSIARLLDKNVRDFAFDFSPGTITRIHRSNFSLRPKSKQNSFANNRLKAYFQDFGIEICTANCKIELKRQLAHNSIGLERVCALGRFRLFTCKIQTAARNSCTVLCKCLPKRANTPTLGCGRFVVRQSGTKEGRSV